MNGKIRVRKKNEESLQEKKRIYNISLLNYTVGKDKCQ
jgi:hypothetical protein